MLCSATYCFLRRCSAGPIDLHDEPLQSLAGLKHVVWDGDEVLANGTNGALSAVAFLTCTFSKMKGMISC